MFACTVVEAVTRKAMFPDLGAVDYCSKLLHGEVVAQAPEGTPDAMAPVINDCFSVSPGDRPTFQTICTRLGAE